MRDSSATPRPSVSSAPAESVPRSSVTLPESSSASRQRRSGRTRPAKHGSSRRWSGKATSETQRWRSTHVAAMRGGFSSPAGSSPPRTSSSARSSTPAGCPARTTTPSRRTGGCWTSSGRQMRSSSCWTPRAASCTSPGLVRPSTGSLPKISSERVWMLSCAARSPHRAWDGSRR